MKNKFKELSHDAIRKVATLAYGNKEWIVSEITVRYNPYIPEHYEDAQEYFEAKF